MSNILECPKTNAWGYCFVVKPEIDYSELISALESVCHMSLEEIAKEGRFSRQSIHNWKKGICEPDRTNRESLLRISTAHNLNFPTYFLDMRGLTPSQREMLLQMKEFFLSENKGKP